MADVTLNVVKGHQYTMAPHPGPGGAANGYDVFDLSSATPNVPLVTTGAADTLVLGGTDGGGRLFVQAYGDNVPQIKGTSPNNLVNTAAALGVKARIDGGPADRADNKLPMFSIAGGDITVPVVQSNLAKVSLNARGNSVQHRTDLVTQAADGQHINLSDGRHILVKNEGKAHMVDAGAPAARALPNGGTLPVTVFTPPAVGSTPGTAGTSATSNYVQLLTVVGGAGTFNANKDRGISASSAAATAISNASAPPGNATFQQNTRGPALERLGVPALANPIPNRSPRLAPLSVTSPIVAMLGDLNHNVLRDAVAAATLSGSNGVARQADTNSLEAPQTKTTGGADRVLS